MDPIEMLLDPNNSDNIVLYGEHDEEVEFEQIALIGINGVDYVLLRPLNDPLVAEDEALVFAIRWIDGERCLVIEEDDETVDAVFEEYYMLLQEETGE
ncbi:MAG: DUF1292 domain-containing protein [Ruminococcaceae bacterium]|nr:DUF1292 domain-containing protein [Oscillospiraceae bacterium]